MKKICHITTGLNIGGAEIFLLNLAVSLKSYGYQQVIISLLGNGDLSDKVSNENIEVIHLGINRYPWTWWSIFKLPFALRRLSPDIVQTWLYHADLLGGLAAIFVRTNLIWNVRQTDISFKNNKLEIALVARIGAVLSKFLPKKIICCSESVKASHVNIGYIDSKFSVIPNGCDTSVYFHDAQKRKTIREILNINKADIVIGRFGRFDPQKDYKNFISAADEILATNENVLFLMAGENITLEQPELKRWICRCRAPEKFILLGKRTDLPDLYQSVDIMVSSSSGEGFPNVVAEAMACEVPCVVTDVGESAGLVGDTGRVVPKNDMKRLSLACQELIDAGSSERCKLGAAARLRIVNFYSMGRSVTDYRKLYDQVSEQ